MRVQLACVFVLLVVSCSCAPWLREQFMKQQHGNEARAYMSRLQQTKDQTQRQTLINNIRERVNTTCRVRASATDSQMQGALNWICGSTPVNCAPINPGGDHYIPNTLRAHTQWAVNEYFWQNSDLDTSCDFDGMAYLYCGERDWQRIRGVNFGGWLLLEPYMAPSLFAQFKNKQPLETAVDEYQFCKILGPAEAEKQLQQHWSTFIVEDDVKMVAQYGLNTIRVPVGWWIFGNEGTPYVSESLPYLDWVIDTAHKYGLNVIIDLHGGPGSQHGFDNSGLTCGECMGICPVKPTWSETPSYLNRTTNVLVKLAQRYKGKPNVAMLEFLNEPRWDTNVTVLQQWYLRTYSAVRAVAPSLPVLISDSFRYNIWRDFMTPQQGYQGVMMDYHIYQAFNEQDILLTPQQHLNQACGYNKMVSWMECMQLPSMCGEWSLATTDCTLYLDGFEMPAKAPGWGVPCNTTVTDDFLRSYAAKQINTWEKGHGWTFWNWKVETEKTDRLAAMWSYSEGVRRGWLPDDVSTLPTYVVEACGSNDP